MSIAQLRPLALSLVVLFGLAFAACSSDPETPAAPPTVAPTAAPETTAAPTVAPTTAPAAAPTAAPTVAPAPTAVPTATPEPLATAFEGVRGIVDPANFGWPRQVEGLNGVVSIPSKPQRIVTASIGHDEMTVALVPVERLVAVGAISKDSTFSNIAPLLQDKPEVTRDPETIIAQAPDVLVTSPFFPAEAIAVLETTGIPVIQTELKHDPEARINAILLMGYILGEEQRALEFAAEVSDRFDAVVSVTQEQEPRPRVLAVTSYADQLWVAGGGATEGGVIVAAGGINAAADAGVESNQTASLEGVIAMAPDVIVIPQPVAFGAEEFRQSLLDNEALAEVPAIANGRVHVVESRYYTTLSYWNIRGAEHLARLLWPDAFPDPAPEAFSLAE